MIFKIFLIIFCLFLPFVVCGSVVINEIAWMGATVSYNDEWIELLNTTENTINLEGWVLKAEDGTPEITLTGAISGNGFYLLERTDDTTVPEISADLIYKGALGNDGENFKLFDNLGNLVDEVNCSSGWFSGDNKTKQTMERTVSGDWQSSQNPGGTPKAENSKTEVRPPPSKSSESAEVEPPLAYASGIVFNEILPSPEGPDETEEWIEMFNQNSFEAELSGWKIEDKEGSTKTYAFPIGSKISPLGYLVLLRPETKITLNNSGDGLEFIKPNGEISDSITFEKAPLGQSYNKAQSGWTWSTVLTPGKENIIPLPPSKEKLPEVGPRAKEKTETRSLSISQETAAIAEKLSKKTNYLLTLLIAFTIAIFSAIIILILKRIITPKSPV